MPVMAFWKYALALGEVLPLAPELRLQFFIGFLQLGFRDHRSILRELEVSQSRAQQLFRVAQP